ncbi:MAG TPA: hypothetical protein VM925_35220 [Labilithrix sp.]|nr:hypothetical protein [Labilithrix sp.]
MRSALSIVALGLTPVLFGGCALIRGLGDFSFADETMPVPSTTEEEKEVASEPSEAGVVEGCLTNRDCNAFATLGGAAVADAASPAICVKATHTCAALLSADCSRYVGDPSNDDAIVLGAVLSEGDGKPNHALEAAAFLAAEEINSANGAGGLPPTSADGTARPLVVVGCNVSSDTLAATRHLASDLHVAAIVGPTSGEAVVDVTQQVTAKSGTLLMTPTSAVSAITNLADDGLTWRTIPSDAQRAKLVIEQMNELETLLRSTRSLTTVKLGVVVSTDASGTSARDAITGKLILNGRFITDAANEANVSLDAHQPGDTDSLSAIATKYAVTFKPDIVFITAAQQIVDFIVPLEKALTAARAVYRPYYVITDAAKTDELIATIAGSAVPSDTRRRIRGVGTKPDTSSAPVLAEFTTAFEARYGLALPSSTTAAAALSYDAMYAIAYAIAATPDQPLSGKSVAQGLRTLGVGDAAAVGAKDARNVVNQLVSHKSVSLRGTFASMSWDYSGDIQAGTLDVWCIGTKDGAPAFGSSGLTMDVQTQVVGGAYVQCQ